MKQARIILTEKCNLDCEYCLMKKPELCGPMVRAHLQEIIDQKYDVYCLTGGEIFCDKPMLMTVLGRLLYENKYGHPNRVYLYTNGTLIQIEDLKPLSMGVNGLNWGLHGPLTQPVINRMVVVNKYVPVRILRLSTYDDEKQLHRLCQATGMTYRIIEKDHCETVPEDRYILRGAE